MSPRHFSAHPTRTCVGCGSRDEQSRLLRLRRTSGGAVVADPSIRRGRSAYVHARPECIRGLVRSKGLGKSLRTTVAKDARVELMQVLDAQLSSGAHGGFASPD
ncbi:MAG: YlxR family protein [Candidatus Binatia bacterium]